MKRLLLLSTLILTACSSGQASVLDAGKMEPLPNEGTLLIVGEGGPSGSLFMKAAETYQREHGGEIYMVRDGDEFIDAFEDFLTRHDAIGHMEYFGHGNHVGLFVNQEPGVNASVYANDVNQNDGFRAASIYELEPDIFSKYGMIQFNGCNVANEDEVSVSLAQKFADYFDVEVIAPTGPTEFSIDPDSVNPLQVNALPSNFSGDVYMIPTYEDEGFVRLSPKSLVDDSQFEDLRKGHAYSQAVMDFELGGFDFFGQTDRFDAHEHVTYAEAVHYCQFVAPKNEMCRAEGYEDDQVVRNLQVLRMLIDANGVELNWTNPWFDSYLAWANNRDLLTEDFVNKKWFTRGELAELSWNFLEWRKSN